MTPLKISVFNYLAAVFWRLKPVIMINIVSLFYWTLVSVCIHFLFQTAALWDEVPHSLTFRLRPPSMESWQHILSTAVMWKTIIQTDWDLSDHRVLCVPRSQTNNFICITQMETEAGRQEVTHPGSHKRSGQSRNLNRALTNPGLMYWPLCQFGFY